jgi:methionyl-tRNA formyltransferase
LLSALITRPVPPSRGRHKAPPNPMREAAEQRGLAIYDPDDINSDEARATIGFLAADLLIVCDYGQILSAQTLALAPLGGINLHASLLPKYRGAAPINWAIYHGETETGVTVIHMTPRLDAGPALVQTKVEIGPNETAVELESRLAAIGANAVNDAIDLLAEWDRTSPIGTRQDPALATKARRLRKEDGQVDWSRGAAQIRNQVRAFKPWPGSYAQLCLPGREPMRLILDAVSVVDESAASAAPGTIVRADPSHVYVATGKGVLSLDRIQPAGKRIMSIDEFLRGHRMEAGQRFT